MTAIECFGTALPAALAAHHDPAVALDTVIRFVATGEEGGDWTVSLKGPTPFCRAYATEDEASIQAVMTLAASDFPAFFGAASASIQLFLEKKLVITGPAGKDALKLRKALALI